ncbi:MAG: M14 family zinc carboxypeptidase [Ignavibacteriales bacterium]|nr:M14 family zinc carboxypeptidase [Ignavibacteriales bacterium]
MRNAILVLFLVVSFSTILSAGELRYSKIRVSLQSYDDVRRLGALGLAVEEGTGKRGRWLDLFVNTDEIAALKSNGFTYQVLIDDWKKYYEARQIAEQATSAMMPQATTVRNFHLGTMGGSLTYSAVMAELDSMKKKYPSIITTRDSIGRTFEGRAIWMVKISKNPTSDENEPRVLFTGLHHAREGAGMMHLMYFMWYLLENYGVDPYVTSLLDHREVYFIPVVNPDGYVYNETNSPKGGGMWRKNRFKSNATTYGIDLNRNYGYRGFSELETQAVRDFCIRKQFAATLNYHTYSNQLIYPWGYSDGDTRDSAIFRKMCGDMTAVNHYTYGTGSQTVGYTTNGDSDDWMYGDTIQKPKIFSMTPEVGNDNDGFWPLSSRILPIAQENLTADLHIARAAGKFVAIDRSEASQKSGNDTLLISLFLANKGLVPTNGPLEVNASSDILNIADPVTVSTTWQNGQAVTLRAVRTAAARSGDIARVVVDLRYDGEVSRDSMVFRIGIPAVVFADDGSQRSQWISATNKPSMNWDTTSIQAHSGRVSYSQSTIGKYSDSLSSSFTLNRVFRLDGSAAELRYWMKWNIETDYDFARIEVSTDNGVTWKAQSGKFTKDWLASPAYFGVRHSWVEETIDLTAYVGKDIRIRFSFVSDDYVNYDGIYIDDISLLFYPQNAVSVAGQIQSAAVFALGQNFPNPFNPSTEIGYTLSAAERTVLRVFDMLGREVSTLVDGFQQSGNYAVHFDGTHLATGIYMVRLTSGKRTATQKILLMK